ncbi:MAG: pyridoxamine 5'-phosphate oxidase family protein [Peptoniphilaceae bacterium]
MNNSEDIKEKDDHREKLNFFIKNNPTAMLTTISMDKGLDSRPMNTVEVDYLGNIYFYVLLDSLINKQIQANNTVHLSYSNKDYLSITGSAETSLDKTSMEAYWDNDLEDLLGIKYDDPNLALLKVIPKHIDYWESANTLKTAFSFLKSKISDSESDLVKKITIK